MTPGRMIVLCGLCALLSFATGMSGCEGEGDLIDGDLLDLAAAPRALFYWGHSTFSITSADRSVLLIDPYDPEKTGYPRYNVRPNVVLMTHDDFDHADTSWWTNNPTVVRGLDASGEVADIDQQYGPFRVRTVPALHGTPAGQDGGNTAIFIIEVDGVTIAHMGDFGQDALDDNQLAAIGQPDFLLVPVGGTWTIDGTTACQVAEEIGANYVLPMHYQTDATAGDLEGQLDTVDGFVQCFLTDPVIYDGNGISLDYAELPTEPTLLLLDYLP